MHWGARERLAENAAQLVLPCKVQAVDATGPRRLTLTRRGPRSLDFDNLAGSYKACVDAFVKAGLLTDDSPQSGNVIRYRQERGKPATVVLLEDL